MTKAEIVNCINQRTGIEKVAISGAVESLMETFNENMSKGENIYLRGFGTLKLSSVRRRSVAISEKGLLWSFRHIRFRGLSRARSF